MASPKFRRYECNEIQSVIYLTKKHGNFIALNGMQPSGFPVTAAVFGDLTKETHP
jgi:hypothetical protein